MPKTARKKTARKKAEPAAESARPLRLEWVEAGSLDANPRNWRHTTPMILREKHRRVAPKAKRTAKRGRS